MKRSMTTKTIFALFLFAMALATAANACDGGREGERCNPLLSNNECGSGLTCQQPANAALGTVCPENYCCPGSATRSSSPYCNGTKVDPSGPGSYGGCPPGDAGADADMDADAEAASPIDSGDSGDR